MESNKKSNLKFDTSFNWNNHLDMVKDELSKAGPSYCLAKWAHSTIHFQLGRTHSCHNLPTHEIPIENLDLNPAALHNTPVKLEQRKLMLSGVRPPECAYCWNIEDLKSNNMSDRILQSSSAWAYPDANIIYNSGLGEKFNPRYLEVSFSSVCNFKCSYCSPEYSSSWADEIRRGGLYAVGYKQEQPLILEEDSNPYIKTFMKWWPSLKKDLKVFRITGGEPLLSNNTWQILDGFEEEPLPNLQFCINSNLGVTDKIIDRFIAKLKSITQKNAVSKVTIFTSIEAMGEDAEYIRHGLSTNRFFKNIEKILSELPEVEIVIMATFCALSVFSYLELLKKIISLRGQFVKDKYTQRLGLSTNYLRFPQYLSVHTLPQSYVSYVEDVLKYMKDHRFDPENYHIGFTHQEISMCDNLLQWMQQSVPNELRTQLQKEFITFFNEHDQRRGTDLLKVFPALSTLLTE